MCIFYDNNFSIKTCVKGAHDEHCHRQHRLYGELTKNALTVLEKLSLVHVCQ